MDAKKVEILLEAVENGSMMGIAGQNGYTPSGLSHLLRRLEAELGVQLVERTNRGIALSENEVTGNPDKFCYMKFFYEIHEKDVPWHWDAICFAGI